MGQLPARSRLARYEILHSIGRGADRVKSTRRGMCLGRPIALKVARISTRRPGNPRRACGEKRNVWRGSPRPNVVAVYDLGSAADRAFIAMQLLDGQTANVWLRTRTPRTGNAWRCSLRRSSVRGGAGRQHRSSRLQTRKRDDRREEDPWRRSPAGLPAWRASMVKPRQNAWRIAPVHGAGADPRRARFPAFQSVHLLCRLAGGAFWHSLRPGRLRRHRAAHRAAARPAGAARRGLSPNPHDRFDSMLPLLAALSWG